MLCVGIDNSNVWQKERVFPMERARSASPLCFAVSTPQLPLPFSTLLTLLRSVSDCWSFLPPNPVELTTVFHDLLPPLAAGAFFSGVLRAPLDVQVGCSVTLGGVVISDWSLVFATGSLAVRHASWSSFRPAALDTAAYFSHTRFWWLLVPIALSLPTRTFVCLAHCRLV